MKINPARQPEHMMCEREHCASERLENTAGLPFHLEKILVPIDFSDCSKKALQYAVPFARQFNARIIFLNVIPSHYGMGRGFQANGRAPQMAVALQDDAGRRLAALAREIVPRDIPVEIETRCGVESAEIVNAAGDLGTNLIVISTRGRTGRAHAFAGSVAEDVARLAPCPVLVVREHEHEFIQTQTVFQTVSTTTA